MAITAYTGLPGSGKSYSIFEHVILPSLKAQRDVWTNIPCDTEKLTNQFGYAPTVFDSGDLADNPKWFSEVLPQGVVCVLDEAWRLWPSGLKANNANPDHLEFIAEHRHLVGESGRSTEIVLATQDLTQIAVFARNLVDKTYRMTKLDAVGQSKRFRIDI
ncbi:zonular occludens toxin domain-containing protein, partial [Nocardia mangyaensis]|uniref:zonular occludens toxin domain-containing protein n=1 Tax=Nocardia mangyaensis TaxID=2213200 RepID=UPI002674F18D